MLKQALSTVVAVSALFASAVSANPLNPSYPTFAAAIDFGASKAQVEVATNPLTPSFYEWNVATVDTRDIVEIVMNNPLQPGYKRS